MTKDEFKKSYNRLYRSMINTISFVAAQSAGQTYYDAFSRISLKTFDSAVDIAIERDEGFPTVNQLRQMVKIIQEYSLNIDRDKLKDILVHQTNKEAKEWLRKNPKATNLKDIQKIKKDIAANLKM